MLNFLFRLLFIWLALSFTALLTHAATMSAPTVADFAARAEKRETLSVVFLGGSLTWGANASNPDTTSYRGLMMQWLRARYPHTPFVFHDAAIGGTGSQLGLFRLDRDVFPSKPDLVFLDYTVNDGAEETDIQSLATYERIVRELLARQAAVMPVLMLFKWHAEKPLAPRPPRHEAHLKLAAAYGLPVANAFDYVRARIMAGMSPDELWNLGDGAHPGDEGYQLLFEAVRDRFAQAITETPPAIIPEATVFADLYPKRTRFNLVTALPQGWVRGKTYRTSLWFDGLPSRWMGDVAIAAAKNNPAPLEIEFDGSFVAVFGERNGFTPPIKVWIDGKPVRAPKAAEGDYLWTLDTSRFAPPKKGSGNLFFWQPFARNLADGKHTLRIEPVWAGTGEEAELHIESIVSAGR